MARRNKGKNRHHEKKQKPHRQRQESGVKPQKAAPSLHFTPGNDEVLYAPLGGAEHIGMNMYLYGHRGKWLMVDCGMGFAHEGLPGIDILLPDISFVEKNRGSFLGIVLTHGHEDHIGAIPYLIDRLQLPLYAAPFCAALIERKLEEVGLINQYPITRISTGQKFHVGPFELEYVRMAHSIPESQGLVINTGIGTLLHTGDWNLDPEPVIGYVTDEKRLRELGNAGVRALIGDSTNILVPGFSGSEGGLMPSLTKIIGEAKGKVIVTCFASNVARLYTLARAAAANDRQVMLVGRSLLRIYDIALELGLIQPFINLVGEDKAGYLPDNKILYISTGCQGEPRSALARIAKRDHPFVQVGRGDTVIFSSREIPGNEIPIQQVQNDLARLGARVITAQEAFVHVSGHPNQGEVSQLYSWIKPALAVPMHGETSYLAAHAAFATEQCHVPESAIIENGTVLRITKDSHEIAGHMPVGIYGYDEYQLIPLEGDVLRHRRRFGWNGGLFISLTLSKKGILAPPSISLVGVAEGNLDEDLEADIQDAILETFDHLGKKDWQDDAVIRDKVASAARRIVNQEYGKKPLVTVHVQRL